MKIRNYAGYPQYNGQNGGGGDRNIDGGRADSTYLPGQLVDGGSASG